MKILKQILFYLLICLKLSSFSQSFTENEIRNFAKQINIKSNGLDLGNGITVRGCFALGRTMVIQHDVDEFWYPPENLKDELIANFKKGGNGKIFFINDIDVDFHYYFKNKLLKSISIKSNEFSNLNFELGDFISIDNHPKAKGINLKIKPPIGWKIEEGDRPNIVKKFVNQNNSYMIITKDNYTFLSRNETKELLADNEFIDKFLSESTSFLKNPVILNKEIVTIDKYPTLVFTFKGGMERSGIKLEMISKNWVIFYEDKIIFLQSGGLNNKDFKTLEGLYNLITNSVIFPEQYNY